MSPEQWFQLAQTRPRRYRGLVTGLAALGLLALVWAPLLALGIFATALHLALTFPAAAMVKLLVVTGLLAALVCATSLFRLRWDAAPTWPEAIASDWLAALQPVRQRWSLPQLDPHITAGSTPSVSVQALPRWFLFGWRLRVTVGLPAVACLTAAERHGALVRELAQHDATQDRLGAWIQRQVTLWRLLNPDTAPHVAGVPLLLRPLARSFQPILEHWAAPWLHQRIHRADRQALVWAGPETASSLLGLRVAEVQLDQAFWQQVEALMADHAEPPMDLYSRMLAFLVQAPMLPANAFQALLLEPSRDPGCPSLGQRLNLLGWGSPSRATLAAPLVHELPQQLLPPLLETLSTAWATPFRTAWRERHHEWAEGARRKTLLEQKALRQELTVEEAMDRAWWTERLEGRTQAAALYEAVVQDHPEHAPGHFALGRLQLQQGDRRGLEHLERAMALDPACAPYAHPIEAAFLAASGDVDGSTDHLRQATEARNLERDRETAIGTFGSEDLLLPHRVAPDAVATLVRALRAERAVREAYLVERHFGRMDQGPMLLLGLRIHRPWYRYLGEAEAQQILGDLLDRIALPEEGCVVLLNADRTGLHRRLKAVEASRLL